MLFTGCTPQRSSGIARLAASGKLLASNRRVSYYELPVRQYLSQCKSSRMPFNWTINPYRGCEFARKYCYARYTHEFMELGAGPDFEAKIFVKHWDPASFREQLRRISQGEKIAIGTVTDPYQPAERRFRITRSILSVLANQKGFRLSITTKSDMVKRDIELLKEIAAGNALRIIITITTLDGILARAIEPYAPHPAMRMKAVRALAEAGLSVAVLACPILPLLNDGEESLDAIAAEASRAGAACFDGGAVFLKSCTHTVFFSFLEDMSPHLAQRYRERFRQGAFLKGAYPEMINWRLNRARQRHGFTGRFLENQPEIFPVDPQMKLRFG